MIGSIDNQNRFGLDAMASKRASKFESMDADGNGVLSPDEIEALIEQLDEEKGVKLDLESFAAALDKDGSGGVDLEEFGRIRPMSAPGYTGHPWGPMGAPPKFGERVFNKLDQDGSGDLSKDEVDSFLTRVNERSDKNLETETVMTRLDEDEDGQLSKDEARGLGKEIGPPVFGFGRRQWRHGVYHAEAAAAYERPRVPDEPGESAPPTLVSPVVPIVES